MPIYPTDRVQRNPSKAHDKTPLLRRLAGRTRLKCPLALLLLFFAPISARAAEVRDDFNDGNDAGWTRHSPLAQSGSSGAFSFPNGGYRIRTTAPSPNPEMFGPGRAYSVRSEAYSDFYIEVDIVNWDNNLPQAFGILARVGTPGLGTTTGYAFSWDRGDTPNTGNVDLVRIDGERTTQLPLSGEENIQLGPGRQYRFVFLGRGPSFEGRIYELPDTARAKLTVTASNATYASGRAGLLAVDDSDALNRTADATFDNFFATDREREPPPPLTSYRLAIPPGLSAIANHFDNGGNTIAELLPKAPEGTLLCKFDSARQIYAVSQFQFGAWTRPKETLAPGQGALIHNPGREFSITFAGAKPGFSQIPQLHAGLNLISLPVPGESSLPSPKLGDQLVRFNATRQSFVHHTFDDLENNWIPRLDPPLRVGESFFYRDPSQPPGLDAVSGGTAYFSTFLPGEVNARILSADGTGIGEGYVAQLYGGPAGAPVSKLVPLTPTTTFQTTSAVASGYVNPVVVNLPGIAPGAQATILMRVFDGASFDASTHRGESASITVTLGGGVLPPARLAGLPGFSFLSPRPEVPRAGRISVERAANGFTLTYTGILQSADAVTGPYSDVVGLASPTAITFKEKARFFRLKPE
ncbi:MAG: hypothetical protein HYY23_08420 [Verrucomicrobia bacterium]|nr:hypothetical protein [Verrucomicrobiota bacterium]